MRLESDSFDFSLMASSLMRSISDFLDNGVDECFSQYDSMPYDHEVDTSTEEHPSNDEDEEEDEETPPRICSRSNEVRQAIIQCCRRFKEHFHEARERASKALGFAKSLRKAS